MNIKRLPEACEKVGLSKPTIYRLLAKNEFPKQVNLGGRAVGFFEHELDEWLAKQAANRVAGC